jgi:hypothetical protein
MTKTVTVNGTDVLCSHVVKQDEAHHTIIDLTVSAGGLSLTHPMRLGSVDEPLPLNYDAVALQKEFDAFRQKAAEHLEGKLRGKLLAAQVK